jgi:hypothetical protein
MVFHYFSKLFHIYLTLTFNRGRKYVVLRNSEIQLVQFGFVHLSINCLLDNTYQIISKIVIEF